MGRLPILKYRKVASLLRKGGAVFIRQRGSHRIWEYGGQKFAVPAHSDGHDVLSVYLEALREYWGLTEAHGVSDRDFLAGRWTRK